MKAPQQPSQTVREKDGKCIKHMSDIAGLYANSEKLEVLSGCNLYLSAP